MATKQGIYAAALLAGFTLEADAFARERPRSTVNGATNLTSRYSIRLNNGRTQTLWLDPSYVAELGPAKSADKGMGVKRFSGNARLQSETKGMRIWKLGPGASSLTGMSAIRSAQPGTKYSHVFREGPASAGQPLVLNGRIIVRFQPGWAEARVREWAAAKGLDVVRKLALAGNQWVLQAEPGLAALEKANALVAEGEVLGARPNMTSNLEAK